MEEIKECPECGQDVGISTTNRKDGAQEVWTFCRHCDWEQVTVVKPKGDNQ